MQWLPLRSMGAEGLLLQHKVQDKQDKEIMRQHAQRLQNSAYDHEKLFVTTQKAVKMFHLE